MNDRLELRRATPEENAEALSFALRFNVGDLSRNPTA